MRKCIWCSKTETATTFKKQAHSIPQSLGGREICTNVCDKCNEYFGNHQKGLPPIETVLKETFGVTRARLLNTSGEIGKNKALPRYSSVYFNIDFKKHTISLKNPYQLRRGFQESIGRQMKKGLYKIYLEETERQFSNGHDSKFDFIREFARYDLGDYPIFYFERKFGAILVVQEWIKHPILLLEEDAQMKYLVNSIGFCEFEFLGHVFGIATGRNWKLDFNAYSMKTREAKKTLFHRLWPVKHFNDVDLTLAILDDQYNPSVQMYSLI